MISFVYISSATKDFSQDELLKLLEQSRSRNATLDITGMLLYANGTFMQVLEGEEKNVLDVYDSILRDKRNAGNYVVQKKPIEERNFPTWSMGFKNLSGEEKMKVPGFSPFLSQQLEPGDIARHADTVVRLLFSFKEQSD